MQWNHVLKISCGLILSSVCINTFASASTVTSDNKTGFHVNVPFLQPGSTNLKYAVFVSGNQPYQQSWHNQEITPGYSSALELGFNYGFPQSAYNASIDWLYFNSNDTSAKQASQSTALSTVQFVAPPYDVGPAVFGIKRADSKVNFNFNSVLLNIGRLFETDSRVQVRIFGGLNFLRIHQTLTTTFSDYAGSPDIPNQAYALPADPSFYFTTKNTSKYAGAGPDVGMNVQYEISNGFGVGGQFMGTLTAGSISVNDAFTSSSASLIALGLSPSHQTITTPNTTQVVPGFDSNLGLFYKYVKQNSFSLKVEAGYRFAYYNNAISEIIPGTLVQAGETITIPEFATGTMAIQSTDYKNSPFSLQGPYINFTFDF